MATIADVIVRAQEFGIFEFYLPFIIMLAITFGILQKAKIFGDPAASRSARNINVILAVSISLFVMVYTPAGITLSQFLAALFGQTLVVILSMLSILMMVFFVLPILGVKMELKRGVKVLVLIIVAIGIAIFISTGGTALFPGITWGQFPQLPTVLIPGLTLQDLALVVLGVLTIAILIFVVSGGGGKNKENGIKYVPVPTRE